MFDLLYMLLGVSMDPSYSLWQTEPQVVDHHGRNQQQAAHDQWVADLANIPVQAVQGNQFHSPQPPSVPDSVAASHVASAYRKSLCDKQILRIAIMNKQLIVACIVCVK